MNQYFDNTSRNSRNMTFILQKTVLKMQTMPTSSFWFFFLNTSYLLFLGGSFASTAGGRQLFWQASCKSGQTFIIHHPLRELSLRKGHQKVDYSLDVSYSHPIKTTEMEKKKKTDSAEVFITADLFFRFTPSSCLLDADAVCVLPADVFPYFFPDMSCQLSEISFRLQIFNEFLTGGENIISASGQAALWKDCIACKLSSVLCSLGCASIRKHLCCNTVDIMAHWVHCKRIHWCKTG